MSKDVYDEIDAKAQAAKGKIRSLERIASSAPLRDAYLDEILLLRKGMDARQIAGEERKVILDNYSWFWLRIAQGDGNG